MFENNLNTNNINTDLEKPKKYSLENISDNEEMKKSNLKLKNKEIR